MFDFETIARIILDIGRTSGRNDKIALLEKYRDNEAVKTVLRFVFDPYVRTGIAATKLSKATPGNWSDVTWEDVVIHFYAHQTGSDSSAALAKAFVLQYHPKTDARELAEAMVTKNLKIGVTDKTLRKVYGDDFIPRIGIMKAEKWADCKDKVSGPFIATEKLDGARRILVKEKGTVTLYSRSGIPDEGLVEIEEEATHLPDNSVYDGELLAVGEFSDAIALRQATNSIANSKGTRKGLTFNLFDMISLDDFKKGISDHAADARKIVLGALFGDTSIKHLTANYSTVIGEFKLAHNFKHIRPVPILGIVKTDEEIIAVTKPIWDRGFEGTMLNTLGGRYDLIKDRSRDILKVKKVEEHVVVVADIEEGTNKNQGKVGALVFEYKGNRVGVGSGLTDAQREAWWNDPNLIIGRKIEIDSFGESKNKQGQVSLNCPIFKRVFGEA